MRIRNTVWIHSDLFRTLPLSNETSSVGYGPAYKNWAKWKIRPYSCKKTFLKKCVRTVYHTYVYVIKEFDNLSIKWSKLCYIGSFFF